MRSGSAPAMQAAAARAMPAADPEVTQPAAIPVISAIFPPTSALRSSSTTKAPAASAIAASTSGRMSVPPTAVVAPRPLMMVGTPISA